MGVPTGYVYKPLIERFMDRVQKLESGCWKWTGSFRANGYGQLYGGPTIKRMTYAHRVAYVLFKGPIAETLQLDHLCRNRWCVNPSHLEAVTCRENLLRGAHPNLVVARTNTCKNGHPLTPENVIVSIRGRYEMRRCRLCANSKAREKYAAAKRHMAV